VECEESKGGTRSTGFLDPAWFPAASGLGLTHLHTPSFATRLILLRHALGYNPSSLGDENPYPHCISELRSKLLLLAANEVQTSVKFENSPLPFVGRGWPKAG
jgi:hypothetical protein